jgi:YidC/Oxa1 family membrane protein insertase
MQQKRLLLALLASTAILFGWNYFFPIKPTQPQKVDSPAATPQPTSTSQATPIPTATSAPVRTAPGMQPTPPVAAAPQRVICTPGAVLIPIKTPLYDAKVDSCGAVLVSWILKKNKDNNSDLYSVGKTNGHPDRLELISPQGLKQQPRDAPLRLLTGDAGMDEILSSSNYRIEGVDANEVKLESGIKTLTFLLHDAGTGLDVIKKIVIDAGSYSFSLEVTLKAGDKPIAPLKLLIGPSIGDQGVKKYTYYSVAPEAVAFVADKFERFPAAAINSDKSTPDRKTLGGPVDWAGVGDTYFAMVAVPSKRTEGLEYRTSAYDYTVDGKTEKRFLVTAHLPITGDGSPTFIYVGPKDHYLLSKASEALGGQVNRNLDLDALIDYGFGHTISRPIAERLLWCIKKLYHLTNSYGVAIILFTIIIYSAFFPLKWRSSKAMKKAQKLAPRMKELQEKIKGMKQTDPRLKELQMEQLRLMKEGNPLGGCLPLLIQMPFLFALYRAITTSLDFRLAKFLWLGDLSAPEPYFIHVLPILMAATMIVLQLITPAPSADPLQRKMMAIGMPLFMLYVLWAAPSGLLVYWLVGNVVGFSQQFLINRYTKTENDDAPTGMLPDKDKGQRKKNGGARQLS